MLLENWKVKTDNDYWLVLTNEKEYKQIVFSKKCDYYRIEPLEVDIDDEDTFVTFITLEEHEMICEILKWLKNV